jgi:hypothetical protein
MPVDRQSFPTVQDKYSSLSGCRKSIYSGTGPKKAATMAAFAFSLVEVLRTMVHTAAHLSPPGEQPSTLQENRPMYVDRDALKNLISKRTDEIEKCVAGTGYLPKTVIGVGTFLLDNECDVDLLSAKQRVTFERFLLPLLDQPRR